MIFWSAKKLHKDPFFHPPSPVNFATATLVACVLLCNSRFNFHGYTQCEATPTQKSARKWHCDFAQKIPKGIHSCEPASLNCPIHTYPHAHTQTHNFTHTCCTQTTPNPAPLTRERDESLVLGLQPPFEDAHLLVEGEGFVWVLQAHLGRGQEQLLVHVGVRLVTRNVMVTAGETPHSRVTWARAKSWRGVTSLKLPCQK